MCNESLGQCVSIKQCSDAIEFNDGSKMFTVRFGDDEEEVESCHYLETCCDPENIIEVIDLPGFAPGLDTGDQFSTFRPIREESTGTPVQRTPPPYPGVNFAASEDNEELDENFSTGTTEDPETRFENSGEVTQSTSVFKAPVTTPIITINVSCLNRFSLT